MIYVVEDDASIRELVTYTLNSQGMDAEGFAVPSQFWKAMERLRSQRAFPRLWRRTIWRRRPCRF